MILKPSGIKSTNTTCPYCGVGCGVTVADDRGSISVDGDQEHPANFGKLCSKGYALAETLGYENRLLKPTIDNSDVTWDEATDRIANEFKSVLDEHGPESIGFYVSGQLLTEDYYVVNKFVKGYLGTANIDTNSRLCMASSVAGHKRAFGSDTVPCSYEDLESAELIVLVGSNLAWCHPVLFQRIEQARKIRKDVKIVVIDPRNTATAQLSDLHLDIASGDKKDAILFSGLLSHLIKEDALDYNWIDQNTNHFDDVVEASLGWTPNLVSEHTGVEAKKINAFYRLFQKSTKVVTVYSQGVNQSVSGTDTVNSIINCHLATGKIGKKGCGPFSITGQPNAMGGREVGGLANMLACHMDIDNKEHQSIVQRFWNSPSIAQQQGLKAVDLFDAVKVGKIKALWVMATNPADSMPAANEVAKAIELCPFVVVSDVTFKTDTASLATVCLPAQAWSEKDGTVTNSERRISRQRRFRTPPSDTRPDWWAVAEVAKKLGFVEGFNFEHAADVFKEFAELSTFENDGTRDFDIGAYASMNHDEYNMMRPFQWPKRKRRTENSTTMFRDGRFFTEDGKARFVAINPISKETNKQKVVPIRPRYPVSLNTGRIRDQWHTMTRTGYIAKLSSHIGEPFIEIHADDAKRYRLKDAGLVDVSSKIGTITVRAIVTENVRKGSAFIPMHWTNVFASNARVNALVEPKTDPFSGQPSLKYQSVKVARSKVIAYGVMLSRTMPTAMEGFDYWAISPVANGWKMEFASLNSAAELVDCIRTKIGSELSNTDLAYSDDVKLARYNSCWFDGVDLIRAVYVSDGPVLVPRNSVQSYLSDKFELPAQRLAAVSGSGYPDVVDQGAIVCSCMNVGKNTIIAAIEDGCKSVESVGKACGAGSQCGSCRSQIAGLFKSSRPVTTA